MGFLSIALGRESNLSHFFTPPSSPPCFFPFFFFSNIWGNIISIHSIITGFVHHQPEYSKHMKATVPQEHKQLLETTLR